MLFIKDKNKQFRLNVIDYEFLSSDILEDLNWLKIKIYASNDNSQWNACGAYLTTTDLSKLYSWFLGIEKFERVENKIRFLEHELSFEYNEKDLELIINLDFDLHPKGKKYDYSKDVEYKMKFKIDDIDIRKVLTSLKKMIDEYPIRYPRDNEIVN